MRIIYHLGVHCTDEERLIRCLLKNRGELAAENIVVPGPAKYRTLLRDTAKTLNGQAADRDTQALVLDQIMAENAPERLILSWENFLGYAPGAVRNVFYPSAGERMRSFCQIFPEAEAEFHIAIRNPATFIPAMFQKQRGRSLEEFKQEMDPMGLRWSEMILNLRDANPDVPITVWCDEDTPLLWPEILQAVCGHSDEIVLQDTDDLLATIMSKDGMKRMAGYLESHPPQNPMQRRRIVSAFLDKFALEDMINVELDFPGWDADLISDISEAYDQDISRLIAMEGVTVLVP